MSTDFPMPKTIGDPPATSPREYAPKRALEAVAEALITERSTLGQGGGSGYKPPIPADYKAPRHQDAIRETLKKLTHREMKELDAGDLRCGQERDDRQGGSPGRFGCLCL